MAEKKFNPRGAPIPDNSRYDGWELTHRPAMIPFLGEYTNTETGEKAGGMAMPAMVTEPMDAAKRLFGEGAMWDIDNPRTQDDLRTILFTLYGGNALNPLARVPKGAVASGLPVRAASKYGDKIFTGRNHGEAYQQAVDKFGESAVDDMLARNGSLDGFIDETGDFIDRLTANERAGGRGLNAYELLPEQQLPSDFMGVLSDNRPSLMGSALASQADALPMDQASRLQRAEDLGFNPSKTWYRGSTADEVSARPMTWVSDSPVYANSFAGQSDGGNVAALHVNTSNFAPAHMMLSPEAAKRAGFDGRLFSDGTAQVFDPSNIRSVNAAFDPARAGENGLLLSDNTPSLLGSALASAQSDEDRAEALKRVIRQRMLREQP